jgi:hypothetical protein
MKKGQPSPWPGWPFMSNAGGAFATGYFVAGRGPDDAVSFQIQAAFVANL